LLRSVGGWNNGSLSRRDNRTRGLLSTRVPQQANSTGGGIPNPSLGIGTIGEAMPRGATGGWRPISLRGGRTYYGAVYLVTFIDDELYLISVGTSPNQDHGRAVSYLYVGEPAFQNDTGRLVYDSIASSLPGGTPQPQPDTVSPGDRLTESLSAAGDAGRVYVGAPGFSSDTGRVYDYSGTTTETWTPVTSPVGLAAGDRFGAALLIVTVSPTYLFVGAPGDTNNTGNLYALDDTTWRKFNNPSGLSAGDEFGSSIAYNTATDRVIVGAPGDSSDTGALYSGELTGLATITWTAITLPTGGDAPVAGDRFGAAVSYSTTKATLYVGAPGYNNGAGRIYQLTDGGIWSVFMNVPSVGPGDNLGASLCAREDDTLIFSAPGKTEATAPQCTIL